MTVSVTAKLLKENHVRVEFQKPLKIYKSCSSVVVVALLRFGLVLLVFFSGGKKD